MSVHYKFKSALEYDTITFDGLHISVKDLKKSILHQKRIGKTFDFDLQVTNAQTKEVYTDDNVLIPKNTSLIIARIPVSQTQKKSWDFASQPNASGVIIPSARPADNEAVADLSKMVGSEEDKIKAMISQSTMDYDPSNYQKVRGANQQGEVPPNYRCFKCHMAGHWIKNCPMTSGAETADIKRNTGFQEVLLLRSQLEVTASLSPSPDPIKQTTVVENKVEIPEDLQCMICKDLLSDAVMIPCCGSSFCDECIRLTLMESEDHECPDCKDKDISPVTMIPNRFLRNSVQAFKLETGYIKTRKYIPKKPTVHTPTSTHASADATVDLDSTANDKSVVILDASIDDSNKTETDHTQENEESGGTKNTVISEADSTQNGKFKETKEVQEKTAEKTDEQTPTVDDTTEVEKPAVVERPPGTEVESDGDDDNITVTMPPPHLQGHGALRNGRHIRPFLRPPGVETPPHYQRGNYNNNGGSNADKLASILDDQRPGTPTVDEQRLPVSSHMGSVSNTAPARTNAMQQEPPGGCGYRIEERFLLLALDRYWHHACLKCTYCQATLADLGASCFSKRGMILCKGDYHRMFAGSNGTSSGGGPMGANNGPCSACGQAIPASELVMRAPGGAGANGAAGGAVFHLACFVCSKCGGHLRQGDRYYMLGGNLVCEQDWQKLLKSSSATSASVRKGKVGRPRRSRD
ncbi:E3 ubiquitin ligase PQT3-like [Ctenocephalides felis]|uniref:E3 ubiquitin ligase PQT3-like n=1 Tax=Ctenocephalides felis TaxID=7515 RepID=UPI000E6E26F3|nr:E3 ubiquitin ligase PQT3-like [Ctenocephalides felis]